MAYWWWNEWGSVLRKFSLKWLFLTNNGKKQNSSNLQFTNCLPTRWEIQKFQTGILAIRNQWGFILRGFSLKWLFLADHGKKQKLQNLQFANCSQTRWEIQKISNVAYREWEINGVYFEVIFSKMTFSCWYGQKRNLWNLQFANYSRTQWEIQKILNVAYGGWEIYGGQFWGGFL